MLYNTSNRQNYFWLPVCGRLKVQCRKLWHYSRSILHSLKNYIYLDKKLLNPSTGLCFMRKAQQFPAVSLPSPLAKPRFFPACTGTELEKWSRNWRLAHREVSTMHTALRVLKILTEASNWKHSSAAYPFLSCSRSIMFIRVSKVSALRKGLLPSKCTSMIWIKFLQSPMSPPLIHYPRLPFVVVQPIFKSFFEP